MSYFFAPRAKMKFSISTVSNSSVAGRDEDIDNFGKVVILSVL